MKTSRRKQTNPNRVAAGTRDVKNNADTSINEEEENNQAIETMDLKCSTQLPLTNGQNSDFDLPLDMHVPIASCSQCSQTFRDSKELEKHKDEMHNAEIKKPRLEGMGVEFPTAYHRLGRELQENTDLPLENGHIDTDLSLPVPHADATPTPLDTPNYLSNELLKSEKSVDEMAYCDVSQHPLPTTHRPNKEGNGGESINGKTDRIFHIDAYCDLCDREFCNKYFLKTHKANKHGIYEDSSPPASNVALPFPGLMIPQDPLTSFNFKLDSMKPPLSEPLLPWSFKLESPSHQTKKLDISLGSKPVDSSLQIFPMTIPHLENTSQSISKINNSSTGGMTSATSSVLSSPSTNATSILTNITNSIKNGSSAISTPSNNDSSMEDYCHICQKHFCNKYYLRKHKQDVHGIAPENPPSNTNKRARSGILDLPMTSATPLMLPQSLASLAGIHNLHGMSGLPNMQTMSGMHPGLMVINPYSLPPVAIIPTGSMMSGQQIPPPSHPIISQPLSMTSLPEANLLHPVPLTSVPSASVNSISHSPVRSSSNSHESAVHCSICSKEFCNDFYLQIHKESKHGIRRNNEEGQRDKTITSVKDKIIDRTSPSLQLNVTKHEPFPLISRSPLERTSNVEGHLLICNFCNKEFSNKYLYRIHRIHDHGLNEMLDPVFAEGAEHPHREQTMNNINESLMRMAADACAVSYASSFGTSPSNKQLECVVCDICNKQIANQHFLRLHKFNCHGKDSNINERYDRRPDGSPVIPISKPKTPPSSGSLAISSQNHQPLNLTSLPGQHPMPPFMPPKIDFKDMSPFADFTRDFKCFRDMPTFLTDTINSEFFTRSQNQSVHMDLNYFGLPSLGKLPGEDNIKLNVDPEAYCEICKKEFCSKYFLRTHKQNIHGMKNDGTSSSSSKSSDSDRTYTTLSQKPILNISNGKSADSMDNNSWRWKEPVNSSRVICDICNKEVCNKYFLRTHKQKKHGKLPTSHSPNVSMSGSPVASDCDTASNASSQPEDKPCKLDPVSLPQMIALPATEKLSEKLHIDTLNFDKCHKDNSYNNNTDQSETCNICSRMFRNTKWLKDHIMKDHSDNEALDMSSKNSPVNYTCQVCGVNFKAELSVQLHLIQEHNARVTLNTEESQIPTEEASLPNSEGNNTRVAELCGRWTLRKKVSNHQRLKKYVCTRCGFDSHWLSSLLDHERNEHGFISDEAPTYTCKSCNHLLSSPNSLSAHIVTVHGLAIEDALHEAQTAEATFPSSFKCAHCPAVFPTRSWAMAHVRHVHIRSRRDLAIKNSFVKNLFQCSLCSFRTHFSFRLQRHVKCRHVKSSRSSYRSSDLLHPSSSVIRPTSASTFLKSCDVQDINNITREENSLVSTCSMYKSIAASLLSECDRTKTHTKSTDTESILLQSYKLCASPIDSSSFKMSIQTPTSAVVGL